MKKTVAHLQKGERAIIIDVMTDEVPLKLLEMGCLPGNEVRLIQLAPFSDPLYIDVNGSHLAIRRETALQIIIETPS
ncbi:ferrous iron transport protein A [Dokdonia sp. Hel_I_63]|uniref:FeoA family protein n=1 Tax=unclassified Dokdonia TaxID=2615033 RepID=UPI00020A7C50|nr:MULTISPECIES: FeoA family protein [unclassified Dokdonia]AEE19383.1 FeoA family protein [Dokdonia sp. 4H-3-7-5]TVZ21382.1 ferrous iron transport protein A [Dokdonia sp. Hel_I_63]